MQKYYIYVIQLLACNSLKYVKLQVQTDYTFFII